MEKQIPGMIRRESRVSKSSIFTPLPWVSSPIEWPVRCVNCSPKPARVITPRDVPLSCWFVSANSARNLGKGLLNDAMHFVGGFHMHLVLCWGKHSFESLYEFRTRDGFDSERANELDCS